MLAADHAPSWITLLRACGADETFLRTYRGASTRAHAAEFLLLDRLFPRSVFAALATAEGCLLELEPDVGAGRRRRPTPGGSSAGRAPGWSTSTPASCSASCREQLERIQAASLEALGRGGDALLPVRGTRRVGPRGGLTVATGWRLRIRHHTGFSYAGPVVRRTTRRG